MARTTLERAVGDGADEPLTLTSPAGEAELDPADSGLAVDVPATVRALTGFTLAPADLWRHVVGGGDQPAVVTVDDAAFGAALETARETLDAQPQEGALSLEGGKVTYTAPVKGTRTDLERTAAAVRRWWPAQDTVEVVAETVPAKVTTAELERVRDEFAAVAVSAPVTVEANGKSFELAPRTSCRRSCSALPTTAPSPRGPTTRSCGPWCTRPPPRPAPRWHRRTPS